MKALTIFLFVVLVQAYSATSYSQNKQVNLKVKQVSVLQVIAELEKRRAYKFSCSPQSMEADKKVT